MAETFAEIGVPLHVVALPPLVHPEGGGEGGGEGGEGGGEGGEGGGEGRYLQTTPRAAGRRLFAEYTAVVCRPDAIVALRVRRALYLPAP